MQKICKLNCWLIWGPETIAVQSVPRHEMNFCNLGAGLGVYVKPGICRAIKAARREASLTS